MMENSPKQMNEENMSNDDRNFTENDDNEIDINDEAEFTVDDEKHEPKEGQHIAMYWPLDDVYYSGTVTAIEDEKTTDFRQFRCRSA